MVRAGQEVPNARNEDAADGASAFRIAEGMVNGGDDDVGNNN